MYRWYFNLFFFEKIGIIVIVSHGLMCNNRLQAKWLRWVTPYNLSTFLQRRYIPILQISRQHLTPYSKDQNTIKNPALSDLRLSYTEDCFKGKTKKRQLCHPVRSTFHDHSWFFSHWESNTEINALSVLMVERTTVLLN